MMCCCGINLRPIKPIRWLKRGEHGYRQAVHRLGNRTAAPTMPFLSRRRAGPSAMLSLPQRKIRPKNQFEKLAAFRRNLTQYTLNIRRFSRQGSWRVPMHAFSSSTGASRIASHEPKRFPHIVVSIRPRFFLCSPMREDSRDQFVHGLSARHQ